MAVRFIVILQY